MNIGLFGIAGVGKSYLTSIFCSNRSDFVTIKASEIIKSHNRSINFHELKRDVINKNQDALITGFKHYRSQHPSENIIIELHNLIETPEGVIEINDTVFDALSLDAVCFLEASPDRLFNQRRLDLTRVRRILPLEQLTILQNQARSKFLSRYQGIDIPHIVLQTGDMRGFDDFINSI